MAKKKDVPTSVFDALLSPDEVISDEEAEALAREAAGEAAPAEEPPAEEPPAEEPKTEETKGEAKKDEAPAEQEQEEEEDPADRKPRSRAQERIQELVAERKELESKLREERERWARLEERQKLISEEKAAAKAAEDRAAEEAERAAARPDPAIDPIGAELWDLKEENRKFRDELTETRKAVSADITSTRQQAEVQAFSNSLNNDLAAFRAAHADYDEAAQFVTRARQEFWQSVGKTPEEAFHLVQQEALAVAKSALDAGQSPAEKYYGLAKQWGWKKAESSAEKPAAIPPKEKLKQIAAGQERVGFGRSANAVEDNGDTDIMSMTPAQFADLPEDQFLMMLKDPHKRPLLEKRLAQLELS